PEQAARANELERIPLNGPVTSGANAQVFRAFGTAEAVPSRPTIIPPEKPLSLPKNQRFPLRIHPSDTHLLQNRNNRHVGFALGKRGVLISLVPRVLPQKQGDVYEEGSRISTVARSGWGHPANSGACERRLGRTYEVQARAACQYRRDARG